jgi:hypothetical protein
VQPSAIRTWRPLARVALTVTVAATVVGAGAVAADVEALASVVVVEELVAVLSSTSLLPNRSVAW